MKAAYTATYRGKTYTGNASIAAIESESEKKNAGPIPVANVRPIPNGNAGPIPEVNVGLNPNVKVELIPVKNLEEEEKKTNANYNINMVQIAGNPYNNANRLYNIYKNGYGFSDWVIKENIFKKFHFKDTSVFFNESADAEHLSNVVLMTIQREPVNIALGRYYNTNILKNTFGWKQGAYTKSTEDKLMPNIAIYCKASVRESPMSDTYKDVHVINLVGYAFDNPNQPDYKFFNKIDPIGSNNNNSDKQLTILIQMYTNMWMLAATAAKSKGMKNLFIYNVGGGVFAEGLRTLKCAITDFKRQIFIPSFAKAKEYCMKNSISVVNEELVEPNDPRAAAIRIPAVLFNDTFSEIAANLIMNNPNDTKPIVDETLFVNAWDPWSIIGNGNYSDNSLDGFWGRSSNMSVLGWYYTNPFMNFIKVGSTNKVEEIPVATITAFAQKHIDVFNANKNQ